MQRACVGLGSNLDDPPARIRRAVEALRRLPESRFVVCSPRYRSPPMGPPDQPEYVNAVVLLDTALSPLTLLEQLQRIETAQGRERRERWGPRTLDLDLLNYADWCMVSRLLSLPHPGIGERRFVLQPLYDVAPELLLSDNRSVAALLAECPGPPLEPLDGPKP